MARSAAVYTWQKGDPHKVLRRPYCCQSWRHEGPCQRREAAVTFRRISDALSKFDAEGWVFFVLTLDRDGFYTGTPWDDVQGAFKSLSQLSRNFMTRLRRLCARNGWRVPGNEWVATVEAHQSGWPHVNLVVFAPELARELGERRAALLDKWRWKSATKKQQKVLERRSSLLDGDLLDIATRELIPGTGLAWGRRSTAEQARSRDALAGYITKLARHLDEAVHEVAKVFQLPTNAEGKFRRLRSGKEFLAPRHRDENITGTMVRRQLDAERSAFGATPLHDVKDPELARMVLRCAELEENRMMREGRALRAALDMGLPYAELAPPPVEAYRLIGENFEVQGEALTIDGERGYSVDAEGYVSWTPDRTSDPCDPEPPDKPEPEQLEFWQ